MCGIFGYIGPKKVVETTLTGLKRLEYRGYDSAGIAGLKNGKIILHKEAGKVAALEKEVLNAGMEVDLAIAHTRWATHGKPTKINAHPHLDTAESLAVVHNGIIENFEGLKHSLQAEGVLFRSDTDTEVIAHLVAKFYEGDFLKAVLKTVPLLKGAFALALIHKNHPGEIIAVGHEAPLVIGLAPEEIFLASDSLALAPFTKEVVFLSHGEIALLKPGELEIFDGSLNKLDKKSQQLLIDSEETSKGAYPHFTLKEIHEQPNTLRAALLSRFDDDYGTAIFDTLTFETSELLTVERILILGCGTSWNAGFVASYFIEELARIPTQVEISSEFRYKNPVIPPGTLIIAISQSGETADTLAAVRELKAKGAKILGICNVDSSSLAREAHGTLFLHAGPEIGVCSTKAFTSQVATLALFALMMARMRHLSKQEGLDFLNALKRLPDQAQKVLDLSFEIEKIAKKYAKYQNFFFIGRNYQYPTALEGALKLKEISYINATGYPAGELKHGPIALISEETPVVALMANKTTHDKMKSNVQEVKARGAPVITIGSSSDDTLRLPSTLDPLEPILTTIACQLLAYYIASERGCDIDQPRNLAKSVTVE